jgi:predicted Zn-dependent protease
MQGEAKSFGARGVGRIAAAALVALAIIVPGSVAAQQTAGKEWIGRRVVQKQRDFALWFDNEQTDHPVAIDVWQVKKVDGARVWLEADKSGLAGWAKVDQLVPIEKAVDYFSRQIRDQPRDAFAYMMRARVWRDKREFNRALADAVAAIRVEPSDAVAFVVRAKIWLEIGEGDKAISD